MKRVLAVLLGLACAPAVAQMNAAQARAVFDRIRTTPAELNLHCEQLGLQEDSVKASMRRDSAALKELGQRIKAIQDKLPGYRDATHFVADKASSEPGYSDTPDGKALDAAQQALGDACLPPEKQ